MPVRTFDPKQVAVIIGGSVIGGFADGEFVRVSRTSDAYSKVTGTDGVISRAKSNDRSGEMTIILSQTSPSNDVLSAIHAADEATNAGVVPVAIKDLSGRSTYVSAFAWIRKSPDSSFGKEITNREWVLDMADYKVFVGGNADVIAPTP